MWHLALLCDGCKENNRHNKDEGEILPQKIQKREVFIMDRNMTIEEAKKILRKKDVQIVIPEGKRKVIAYITGCRYDLAESLLRRDDCVLELNTCFIDLAIQDTYRAIAKCHPEDTFDEAKGIEIAIIKLAEKYLTSQKKAIRRVVNRLERQLNALL